jgi:RHS repeat-associated protein
MDSQRKERGNCGRKKTYNNQWTAGFEYDIVGNLRKTTDAKGSVITNDYDKAGRVTLREYNNLDTPSVNYYYDGTGLATPPPTTQNYAKGKLTKVMSSISTTQYTSFDNLGRNLVSQQLTDGQTYESKYKYDFGGRLVEQTYPSGKVVRNFFENDGDLAKVVRNGKTYVSDFSYNASGGINSLKLGNGRWETAEFNSRQQMTQIGLGSNATANDLWKLEFKYGELAANGVDVDTSKNTGSIAKQIITLPNVAFTQTYKYDALERLTEAKEVSTNNQTTWQQSWNYDRFGNRTAFNSNGVGLATINTTPAVNPNTNRFTSTDYQYDKAGNITKDISNGLVREFIFNGDNKQVHVKDANNVAIGTYYYDGNGARVKKTTANETTIFVYDGDGTLVAEYSTATPTVNPTVSYTTSDHLGSPRVITDKNGQVTSRRDFMPFGEELNAEGTYRTPANKFSAYGVDNIRKRFTGYEKDDETQLDFAEARYYNNKHGRFTAVDPLLASGKSSDPQTFNRYIYCSNNPIICSDPSGMDGTWYQRTVDGRTEYKNFADKADEGWSAVNFGSSSTFNYTGCRNTDCTETDRVTLSNNGTWKWNPEPLAVNVAGAMIPNVVTFFDQIEGRRIGATNFLKSIGNLPIETPIVSQFPFPNRSLASYGVRPFFEYEGYRNTPQRMAGIETQLELHVASFAAGGALKSGANALKARTTIFEVSDGVRRVKAAESAGLKTINAVDNSGKVFRVPIKNLRIEAKSALDLRNPAELNRFREIYWGFRNGDKIPPIYVNQGSRGIEIFKFPVIFK